MHISICLHYSHPAGFNLFDRERLYHRTPNFPPGHGTHLSLKVWGYWAFNTGCLYPKVSPQSQTGVNINKPTPKSLKSIQTKNSFPFSNLQPTLSWLQFHSVSRALVTIADDWPDRAWNSNVKREKKPSLETWTSIAVAKYSPANIMETDAMP